MALKREMGTFSVFSMATGAMISSGLFVLPAIAFARVGPCVFVCYLLACMLLLPSVLTKAELMTAMPKAGGTYFHLDRSFGPGLGTVGGIANWAALAFKGAFALLGIGALTVSAWPGGALPSWTMEGVACAFCLVFAGVNLLGGKHAGRLQSVLVVALLVLLAAFVAVGLPSVQPARFRPLLPRGWNSLLIGTGMVFISFAGVTKVANLAEEVRRPHHDLLWGMFLAYGVVGVLSGFVVFVAVGLLPPWPAHVPTQEVYARVVEQWTLAPLSAAAGGVVGMLGVVGMGLAALCAFLTTGNAGILTASRTLMAMGQDDLVPPWLGRVGLRGTPARAIGLTCAFMVVVIVLLPLELFVKAASAIIILLFFLELVALVLMRESRMPSYRPSWRCPFYPWMQVVGLLAYAFLLVELGTVPLAIAGVILGGAFAWYAFYAKVHVLRESALIRLAERLAAVDFGGHDIEAELARVIRERDRVLQDRFDHLVQECRILDVQEPLSREGLFRALAGEMAPALRLSPEEVYELFLRREAMSSTVIRPGLAIPHIIAEGLERLHIMLVRSRPGVVFTEAEPPVHIIFFLAVPLAERNFYLKALMAIAEIAQDEQFDERWMAARGVEALREVVLAAERRREPPGSPD